jgi:hypothetical protein
MKKLFFTVIAGMCLASCKDSGTTGGNSAADKAMANNRTVISYIEKGDVSKLDSFITKDAVDHSGAGGMSEVKGLENIKKDLATIKQDFSDFKIDIQQEAANGDYLFVLGKMTGTTTANPGHGMPPNKKIEMTSVDVLKFNKDGMFTDHWTFNDPNEMMKMMGGGDKPMDADKSKMDTTKK